MSPINRTSERRNTLRPVAEREFSRQLIDSLITLRLTYKDWIVRRVDRVTFLDTETTRKDSEFHLVIPRGLPTVQMKKGKEKVHLLPLVTFERNVPLRSLKVLDESGAVLSTLTKEEHRMVLDQIFDRLQHDAAAKLTSENLERIYSPKPDRGPSLSVPRVVADDKGKDVRNWWSEELEEFLREKVPREEIALRTFVIDLWLGYIHLVVVPMTDHGEDGNRRRVITLGHEERVVAHDEPPKREENISISGLSALEGEFGAGLRHLRRLLGLREYRESREIGRIRLRPVEWLRSWVEPQWVRILWAKWYDDEYGSCHTEINVPPELEVRQAFLYQRHYDANGTSVPGHGRDEHFRGRWSLFTSAYTGSSAHLLQMGSLNGWELHASSELEPGDADSVAGRGFQAPETQNEAGKSGRGLIGWIRGQRDDQYLVTPKNRSPERSKFLRHPEASERGLVAIVSIILSARSEGLRLSAMFVGAFSLAMLFLAGLLLILYDGHEREVPLSLEVLATVLVFAPTVAAAIISQRASHPMTEELTARLRHTVVIFGVLPVIGVIVLAMTNGLGPYQQLGHLASGLLITLLFLLGLALLGVLWIQRGIEKKIEPEPLPPSAYWSPQDPAPYGERELTPDEEARRLVETSLHAQPSVTKVVQSVEGLRLPSASFYLVAQSDDRELDGIDPRHGWLTDGALRRAARKFAASAGIDLT